jgi:hypothetical protein
MLTAYTTALPPSGFPAAGITVAVVGADVLFAVLLTALAVLAGAILQRTVAAPHRRPALRLVDTPSGGAGSLHAA